MPSTLSGVVKAKYGTIITGASVQIDAYDKDSRDTRVGTTTSNSTDGTWTMTLSTVSPGTLVLVLFSYDGDAGGMTDPAGAEFLTTE